MHSAILVHPRFDGIWPWSADHARRLWERDGEVEFIRTASSETRVVSDLLSQPDKVTRLLVLGVPMSVACTGRLAQLKELAWSNDGLG